MQHEQGGPLRQPHDAANGGCDKLAVIRVSCQPSLRRAPADQDAACATPLVPWPDSDVPVFACQPHATANVLRGELVTPDRIPQSAELTRNSRLPERAAAFLVEVSSRLLVSLSQLRSRPTLRMIDIGG